MFQVRERRRPVLDWATSPPLCPNCGRPMHLDRVALQTGGQSELTFKCGECWVTQEEIGETH
jgi:hypothetical protein